jgi:hypothetical protein
MTTERGKMPICVMDNGMDADRLAKMSPELRRGITNGVPVPLEDLTAEIIPAKWIVPEEVFST